ncbi:unnamed protein product [Paramecium sonneborni]|uniref:Cyclic nucleotide-binding domain-containing protein n=1 Tax=Paramecium sonneborni TaxID=65129 RepID=A0A8S1MSM7_9CILI|nr:unnamed protein product [Paramecium sonneborni]
MQQDNEATSLSISRRAAYNYIRPILHEDSLVQTPTTSFRSGFKQNTQKPSIFKTQLQSNEISIDQFPLLQSFDDNGKYQSQLNQTISFIANILNKSFHSIISIYVILISFFQSIEQLIFLRIIGMIFLFSNITLCILMKQKALDSSQITTLILYVFSFIFEDQILTIYLFISIFHIQNLFNLIKVSIIIITKQYSFTQFLFQELIILLYTVHLNACFFKIFMNEFIDTYSTWFIYLQSINSSFQMLLFEFQIDTGSTKSQLTITFFIIFNINYYLLILKRYEKYQKSFFLYEEFQLFLTNRCIQISISLLEMLNFLWFLLNIKIQDQFLQQLDKLKIQVYVDQLRKCQVLQKIFSEQLLKDLANEVKVIKVYKNEIVLDPGLYIIIEGRMKIYIQAEFEAKKILKEGDYFGLIEMILNKNQNFFLKSIKKESILIYISGEAFHCRIKDYSYDYEIMRYIHDQMLFTLSTKKIKQKCYFCEDYHLSAQCKLINFKPEFDLEKLKQNELNDRQYFQRSNVKQGFQIKLNSESSKDSHEYEESFEIDRVSSEIPNDRQVCKNILGSISQMIICNSKISQEGTPQLHQTQSFRIQESQTQQNPMNTTTQGWKQKCSNRQSTQFLVL